MKMKIKAAVAASAAGVLALTALLRERLGRLVGGRRSASSATRCSRPPTSRVFADFQDTDAGKDAEFRTSYGASGDQSRAVDGGLDADVVHFSLETDVTRLVDAGLVADDWKDNPTKGIATSSVVVFVVRKGNPENIQTWDDLVKPGVEIITPEPGLLRLRAVEHPRRLGARRRQRRHRGGGQGLPDEAAREHHRAARQRPRRHHRVHRAATATCCSPTRTRRSSPSRAVPTSTTSSRTDTLLIENPAAVTKDAAPDRRRRSWTSSPRRGAGGLRQVRLPPGRRRRRRSPRSRAPTTRPTRSRPRRSCSPSTMTSAAGPRPPTKFFDDGRTAAARHHPAAAGGHRQAGGSDLSPCADGPDASPARPPSRAAGGRAAPEHPDPQLGARASGSR